MTKKPPARKKVQQPYAPQGLMLRSVSGIILLALAVLAFISVTVNMDGVVFEEVRKAVYGLAGGFSFVLPVFLGWAGVLLSFSARKKMHVRSILLSFGIFLCLLAIIDLGTTVRDPLTRNDYAMMDYIFLVSSKNINNPNPENFISIIKETYFVCSATGQAGGAMGILLAWPLYYLLELKSVGSIIVLSLIVIGLVLIFSRLDIGAVAYNIRQRSKERQQRNEAEYNQQAIQEELWRRQEAMRMANMPQNQAYMGGYGGNPMAMNQAHGQIPTPQSPMPGQAPIQAGQMPMQPFMPEEIEPDESIFAKAKQGIMNLWGKAFSQNKEAYGEDIPYGTNPNGQWQYNKIPNEPPMPNNANVSMSRGGPPVPFSGIPAYKRRPMEEGDNRLYDEVFDGAGGQGNDLDSVKDYFDVTKAMERSRGKKGFDKNSNAEPLDRGANAKPAPRPSQDMLPWEDEFIEDGFIEDDRAFEGKQGKAKKTIDFDDDIDDKVNEKAPPTRKAVIQDEVKMSGQRLDTPNLKLPEKAKKIEQVEMPLPPPYAYPSLEMLKLPKRSFTDTSDEDAQRALKLEETLESFKISAKVKYITRGPAITRFELELASGINVSRITRITDNIALNMAANGVRIEAPIPGTSLVGIEVPNPEINSVTLREVLQSEQMVKAESPLAVALGKDIAGTPVICDLSKMPHLLIAGATGSGKSVCINSIINSIIYRSTPEQVRLILIDPKVVELQCYNGIPHLIIPVVSDPHKAAGALSWAVTEMMERYHKFTSKGVRDMAGYNAALSQGEEALPRILVIIDELADLMLACKKDVEESICRLAQLARAAGIHLVVATQRPSVDVITGLIKANIPSRIAFAVSSNIDSRTILDAMGAEKLLGRGDMLYSPSGSRRPIRVQGCFVTDGEVNKVTSYIRSRSETDYDINVMEQLEQQEHSVFDAPDIETAESTEVDPLLPQAIEMAVEDGQTSISMLQRRLRIGYARSGRLIDEMTRRGIISQAAGAKPREVLISREDLASLDL